MTPPTIRPLADRVLVRDTTPDEPEPSTGGVYKPPPKGLRAVPTEGEVVAVGPGRLTRSGERVPIDVDVGDTVRWTRHSPTDVPDSVDGADDLMVVKEEHLMGVVDDG